MNRRREGIRRDKGGGKWKKTGGRKEGRRRWRGKKGMGMVTRREGEGGGDENERGMSE